MSRLLTDTMLGSLTTYLRMCGYDTVYALDADLESDEEIRRYAQRESRVVLTRDRELAASTDDAVLLERRDVEAQLEEVVEAGIGLALPETPQRCSTCNGRLEPVAPEDRTPEYAPDPLSTDVWRCRECGQHFWKGSHWDDVADTLASIQQ